MVRDICNNEKTFYFDLKVCCLMSQNKPYKGSAKTIGHFMSGVTRPVFEKFGFQRAALITDWESIIGAPLCHFTVPEEIKWNNANNDLAEVEQYGQKKGATLVLRVEGPAALEVQHQAPQIIERINSYFGYRAIADIRILQAPLERSGTQEPVKRFDLEQPIANETRLNMDDERMESAFKRLWRGIQTRKINNRQKK